MVLGQGQARDPSQTLLSRSDSFLSLSFGPGGRGAFIPVGASEKADDTLQLPAAALAPRGDGLPGEGTLPETASSRPSPKHVAWAPAARGGGGYPGSVWLQDSTQAI